MRTTRTFAVMEVSTATFKEIHAKLKEAGYDHAINQESDHLYLDMHGIALCEHVNAFEPCEEDKHEWMRIRSEIITEGEMCKRCGITREGSRITELKQD